MTSTIRMGVHSTETTLEDLKLLPAPKSLGRFHKPIHPAEIIETVSTCIKERDHEVVKTRIAVNPKMSRVFATMDLEPLDKNSGRSWSIGLISSVDKTAAMKLAAGTRIFVCDNLMATGDVFQTRKKHTTGFQLEEEVGEMVDKVLLDCKNQETAIKLQADASLDEATAYRIIGETLAKKFMSAIMIQAVQTMWLNKMYEDVIPRTVLGLHNAFTRQVQKMTPAKQLPTTIKIGKFFSDMVCLPVPSLGQN